MGLIAFKPVMSNTIATNVANGHPVCGYSKSFEVRTISFSEKSWNNFVLSFKKDTSCIQLVFAKYINSHLGV